MSRELRILAASLLIMVVSTIFLAGAVFAANEGSPLNENKASWGQTVEHDGDGICDYDQWQHGKQ